MGLLPKEGNFATLKITRHLQESVGVNSDEYKEFGIKKSEEEEGKITWNVEKGSEERPIEIEEAGVDIIKEALRKLSDEGKLTHLQFSLYEKFIEATPKE